MLLWLATAVAGQLAQRAALDAGTPELELRDRERALAVFTLHQIAAALAFGSGFALMQARGWSLGYPRWLAVKIGLTLFLLVPLEAMHAWICQLWIRPGLAEARSGGASRRLARGLGMDEMLRALAVPLLGVAIPLLLWLSLRRPF